LKTKIFSILLIISFIVPTAITYSWLQYKKISIRNEVERKIEKGIDKKNIKILAFSKQEVKNKLKWHKKHEFEYKNQLYDIIKITQKHDSITYYCWNDKEETHLNAISNNLVNHSNNTKKSKNKLLTTFYFSLFFEKKSKTNIFRNTITNKNNYYYLKHIKTIFIEQPSPPPKNLL
jgi:hypothetical protein